MYSFIKLQSQKALTMVIRNRIDIVFCLILSVCSASGSYMAAKHVPRQVLEYSSRDVWFQGASDSILLQLSDRESPKHARNNIHPFFSIISHPYVFFISKIFGVELEMALRLMMSGVAFCWAGSLFILLRLLIRSRSEAIVFCTLGIVSASFLFWFSVPETFAFGSLSILLALIFLILTERYPFSTPWYIFVNLVSFSCATTNWMAGILITMVNHRVRQAVQILMNFFAFATVLWGILKLIYPESRFFLEIVGETAFVNVPQTGGPVHVLKSFLYHTMIAPAIRLIPNPNDSSNWPSIMSMQLSAVGSASLWGLCGVILWGVLLVGGVWALFSIKAHVKFRTVLGFLLLGQATLHAFYGEETFLYSLHFVILLVLLVALSSLTRLRRVVICVAIALIPIAAINNIAQFRSAIQIFDQLKVNAQVNQMLQPMQEPS